MKYRVTITLFCLIAAMTCSAQTLFETDTYKFKTSGYLRTGFGNSEGGTTQAHFQMPGALNKYSLGNQADTYGELEFDYTHYLDKGKTKSIDVVWMTSIYEDFGTEKHMSYNFTEQLYVRFNNLFGADESIWVGDRFYDRRAVHMLDRQWINPGQKGFGAGIENFINRDSDEDLKFAVWQFKDKGVTSYKNGRVGDLTAYTFDVRWINKPISPTTNLNFALNYSYRAPNNDLGYEGKDGYGVMGWIDYAKEHVTNTTAVLFRQGANVSIDHWSGMSQKENPGNDNIVMNDLSSAYTLEINNNFLYDNLDNFAVNVIVMLQARDYGTSPYRWVDGKHEYLAHRGNMFYWASAGARAMYYITDNLRPSLEYTYEYGHNDQLGAMGSLCKLTFTPELSLHKGFYDRPVLRPFVTYAWWGDGLEGFVGSTPLGAPYGDNTSGFTYGLQFEIWW